MLVSPNCNVLQSLKIVPILANSNFAIFDFHFDQNKLENLF